MLAGLYPSNNVQFCGRHFTTKNSTSIFFSNSTFIFCNFEWSLNKWSLLKDYLHYIVDNEFYFTKLFKLEPKDLHPGQIFIHSAWNNWLSSLQHKWESDWKSLKFSAEDCLFNQEYSAFIPFPAPTPPPLHSCLEKRPYYDTFALFSNINYQLRIFNIYTPNETFC